MKLNLESLQNTLAWESYRMPHYDIPAMRAHTKAAPLGCTLLVRHNIFRAFPAVLVQRMLNAGLTDNGISSAVPGISFAAMTNCHSSAVTQRMIIFVLPSHYTQTAASKRKSLPPLPKHWHCPQITHVYRKFLQRQACKWSLSP